MVKDVWGKRPLFDEGEEYLVILGEKLYGASIRRRIDDHISAVSERDSDKLAIFPRKKVKQPGRASPHSSVFRCPEKSLGLSGWLTAGLLRHSVYSHGSLQIGTHLQSRTLSNPRYTVFAQRRALWYPEIKGGGIYGVNMYFLEWLNLEFSIYIREVMEYVLLLSK